MTSFDHRLKRCFDVCLAFFALIITWPIILVAWLISFVETGKNGFFRQLRVGKEGSLFYIIKIRTMHHGSSVSTVTVFGDARITHFGKILRRFKLDELPQLFNVIRGDMSFVGPRPDVPGFADMLVGSERMYLTVRPGITGPASIKYKNEEYILSLQRDPESYNKDVIWPDKVAIGLAYIENWSLLGDFIYILRTFL